MTRTLRRLLPLLALAATSTGAAEPPAAPRAAAAPPLVLAVVPNLPAVALHERWTPFVDRIARTSGVPVTLKLYDRIGQFVEETDAGVPDLVFAAPNMFFLSRRAQGYVPLVRSAAQLRGAIFVRRDSPITSVQELKGKTIAFVGPRNICSVLTQHALRTAGTSIDFNATFAGSTVNVAKSVLLGKADAGASLDGALQTDLSDAVGELRIILETPPVASHPLAAHPRVPAAVRERIVAAVTDLAASAEGRRLLEAVRLADPVRADYDRDYRLFDQVDFEKLARPER